MTGKLSATLIKAHRHGRLARAVQFLLAFGAGWLAAAGALFVADNLFNLSPAARLAGGLGLVGAAAAALAWLLGGICCARLQARRLAVRLEQLNGIADNSLINALHFAADPTLPPALQQVFQAQAARACAGIQWRRLWDGRQLRRLGLGFALAAGAALVYALGFAPHARNALARCLDPQSNLTPLNYTQFQVEPGDARLPEGATCPIAAHAWKFGRPVSDLDIVVAGPEGEGPRTPMTGEGGRCLFELKELRRSLRYRIANGNDSSRWFRVEVQPAPRLTALSLRVQPPAYTGQAPAELSPLQREAALLAGSQLLVAATPPPGYSARLSFAGKELQPQADGSWVLPVAGAGELALALHSAAGLVHPRVWYCRLQPRPDLPPTIQFANRELNVQLGMGQTLAVQLHAADDLGLAGLRLALLDRDLERPVKEWQFAKLRTERDEVYVLPIAAPLFAPNASYRLQARVWDSHQPPNEGSTPVPLSIHVVDLARATPEAAAGDSFAALFRRLGDARERQQAVQSELSPRLERVARGKLHELKSLQRRQADVHRLIAEANGMAQRLRQQQKLPETFAAAIAELQAKYSQPLLRKLQGLDPEADPKDLVKALNEVLLAQAEIVRRLQELLGEINRERLEQQAGLQQLAAENQDQKLFDALGKLKQDLETFREEQKKIQAATEALDKKKAEDWTDQDEQLLGNLAARQEDLAHFYKAAFNDLSKVQNQDFSNSQMAEELVELYEELQKAGAALEGKKMEIATSAENMGIELAESIKTNIERWLADKKDSTKWTAEENGKSPDVPLQDLPQELSDIVGDLIDDLKDMAENDAEDSSNSYLGAFDEGIGWGSGDGNLNDMSAKGITGNSMPNDSEVSGRSGEGRSGKSSGQFVEEEATGKGGRDTPTRLTASPFEQGTVKDSSKDPQGGATGGGKQSGTGGEGLHGQRPDHLPGSDERLPAQSAELKQKAEALMRQLTVQHLPTADLEEAIAKMGQIAQQRDPERPGLPLRAVQSDIVASLRDAQAALKAAQAKGAVETGRRGPATERASRYDTPEPVPPGYERSVQAYFKALAEAPAQ